MARLDGRGCIFIPHRGRYTLFRPCFVSFSFYEVGLCIIGGNMVLGEFYVVFFWRRILF